jgi:hypothetical protein
MIPALPSRCSQSECGRLSRISPNSESASFRNAIQLNQTLFQNAVLLDIRGGRHEIEDGEAPFVRRSKFTYRIVGFGLRPAPRLVWVHLSQGMGFILKSALIWSGAAALPTL